MIYELLEYLKSKVESETKFKAVVLPALPGFYTLNTAYIIVPDSLSYEFAISSGTFSNFNIDIYFVVSDCNADDISTMSNNILKGYQSASQLANDVLPRGERSYSDDDMDANCRSLQISMKTWMTGGKIPVSVHVTTEWRAILKG